MCCCVFLKVNYFLCWSVSYVCAGVLRGLLRDFQHICVSLCVSDLNMMNIAI